MPERVRRRPPRWLLVTAGAVAVLATVVVAIVRSIGPASWEQAAIHMAPEFANLVLPDHPYDKTRYPGPQTDKWHPTLQGISLEAVYNEGQTLDTIQHRVEAATGRLGLLPPLCRQVDAAQGYKLSGQLSRDGMLGCSIFDTDRHSVGWLYAKRDDLRITVRLSFGEGRGSLSWPGIDKDDLP